MTSTFYALPCKCGGESFLLRTNHTGGERAILVDAAYPRGRDGSHAFDEVERYAPDLRHIDVAVCTHSDSDHAAGFPTFIRNWVSSGRTLGEMWLPGLWALAVADGKEAEAAIEAKVFIGALEIADLAENSLDNGWTEWTHPLPSDNLLGVLIAELAHQANYLEEMFEVSSDRADFFEHTGSEKINERQRDPEGGHEVGGYFPMPYNDQAVSRVLAQLRSRQRHTGPGHLHHQFARSASELHRRIQAISEVAREYGVRIRYFDFERFKNGGRPIGGIPSFFEPVNSVEVRRTRVDPSPAQIAFALLLSQQNVESLVFLRIGGSASAPVLFTADSRLAFGSHRPQASFPIPASIQHTWSVPLVTAPHHGSKTNEHAYDIISSWFSKNPIFVRAGGRNVTSGLAHGFLKTDTRLCVSCNGSKKILVKLEEREGEWQFPIHPLRCCCL